MLSFHLPDEFVSNYQNKTPPFGFGALSETLFARSYSRKKPDGSKESWTDCIRRVVEGCYSIQKDHIKSRGLGWDEAKAKRSAQEMFNLMWNLKLLPPGRGLFAMGTEIVHEKGLTAALYNCSFVSTQDIATENSKPFRFLADMSMLGVGVGFDTRGAGTIKIKAPKESSLTVVIHDSREGWVDAIGETIDAYLTGSELPTYDFSAIRPRGAPIKTFGGIAPGPQPLIDCLQRIRDTLAPRIGEPIKSRDIVDVGNIIGACVVSGNLRRTAEITFGAANDHDFSSLKNYEKNPYRAEWGWVSNNTVLIHGEDDLTRHAANASLNGEPGFQFQDNVEQGRLGSNDAEVPMDFAIGGNPCQPAWATVLTPDGISTIGQVKEGDLIWTGKRFAPIAKKWSTGVKEVNAYRTTAGTFYGTENHRIVQNGVKIEAKNAESIDLCLGPDPPVVVIDQQTVMDGIVLGDGSVHKASNNLVYLCVGAKDGEYKQSEISDLMLKARPGIHKGGWEVATTIKASELPMTFNRVVPDRFFYGSDSVKAAFLRGLFTANGSMAGGRVTLKQTSFKLIEQVQQMLSSIGIRSYYTVNKARDNQFSNGVYRMKESYDLNITSDRAKFESLIGFIHGYKMDALYEALSAKPSAKKPKVSYDIKAVEHVSTEEVFDITVDDEDHTYWTGGLLVSNCGEIPLESYELCCLSEVYPAKCVDYNEFKRALKYAYLYAKVVALLPTHWEETNRVKQQNLRIGISQSGVVQAITKLGLEEYRQWCDQGYYYLRETDRTYSRWMATRESVRLTTVKPSGSISILSGATSGVHWPPSRYVARRMRLDSASPLVEQLKARGVHVEPAVEDPTRTVVATIPIDYGVNEGESEVSMWRKAELAAFMQRWWADNAVSNTITFRPDEAKDLVHVAESLRHRIKSCSFLPIATHGYEQLPVEPITEDEYDALVAAMRVGSALVDAGDGKDEKFCDSGACQI